MFNVLTRRLHKFHHIWTIDVEKAEHVLCSPTAPRSHKKKLRPAAVTSNTAGKSTLRWKASGCFAFLDSVPEISINPARAVRVVIFTFFIPLEKHFTIQVHFGGIPTWIQTVWASKSFYKKQKKSILWQSYWRRWFINYYEVLINNVNRFPRLVFIQIKIIQREN